MKELKYTISLIVPISPPVDISDLMDYLNGEGTADIIDVEILNHPDPVKPSSSEPKKDSNEESEFSY